MSEYTKGPWIWIEGMLCAGKKDKNGCYAEHILWPSNALSGDDGELSQAELMGACGKSAEARAEANARLMAASPDIYEALQVLRSFMWSEGYADQTAAMAQADAAIRKAEDL